MKAVVQHEYGGPEQLAVGEVPEPSPGSEEVLVRVHAAGIDRGTWHLMEGMPLLVRPYSGLRRPKRPVPGRDLAGVVVAVGPGVTAYAVGDEVIGTASNGSFAELAVVPTRRLARKPASVGFPEAAVLAISGLTALQAVRRARLGQGQRVLVTGASGGVGVYAVQLAAAAGAEVTAVASAAKHDLVRSLGAARALDYAREQLADSGVRFDVILDIAGRWPLRTLRRALAPRGTLVIVGSESASRWFGGMEHHLAALLRSPFTRQRLTAMVSSENAADMQVLSDRVDRGELRPVLDRTFALDEASKALAYLQSGHARGKLGLTVASSGG